MFVQKTTLLKDSCSKSGPQHRGHAVWNGSPGSISKNVKGKGISKMGPTCTDMKSSMSLCNIMCDEN